MALPAPNKDAVADNRTTMELGKVLPKTANVIDGHLFVGGVDMVELARTQGTAMYVYDEEDLRDRMRQYRTAFDKRCEDAGVAYASKAFLNKAMARIAKEEGMHLDVSGGGELAIALAAGFPADRIVVHGNSKTELELTEAIQAGAGRIVVDSITELERISRIAGELGKVQDVFLRITPGVEADTHDYIKTGCEDSKFGFTMRDDFAFESVLAAISAENVRLAGLHMHIGSQILKLEPFAEAIDVMIELFARVKEACGYEIDELDVGGGPGVAYQAEDVPAVIDEFARIVTDALNASCEKYGVAVPRVLCEPGRSIVATPGITLYTVGTIKNLPGIRKFVAVDGGMSDNIRTALYHASYEAAVANKADQPRTQIVTIVGKHCESGDAVVLDGSLQEAQPGDVVCVFGTGAYCHSMSSNYNGNVRPAVVFVKDGQARVVSRRQTYADLMACDVD